MKVATFNINNINRRLPNLLAWLRTAKPDVVSLQELKAADAEFPLTAIEKAGYGAVWRGQKTWNGVAILARNAEPVLTRTELPGGRDDREARYIEAAVNGIIVTSIYLPNGNPQPGPKFDYKLDWFKRLRTHAAKLLKQDIPIVLAGDYNVAPTELDIYPTKSWDKDALIQPKSRAAYKALIAQGWTELASYPAPVETHVYVLGLQAQPLAAGRRTSARSSAAEPRARTAPDQGRCRPQRPRRGRRQRSRAGVDRAALRASVISQGDGPRVEVVIPAKAGIQYAAAYRFNHCYLWNTGSPAGVCHRARRRRDPVAGDDDRICLHVPAARCARGLLTFCPSENQRAQGRPGARCTRGLVRKLCIKKAHTSIQVQRRQSGLPCAMVLRLIPCSPR